MAGLTLALILGYQSWIFLKTVSCQKDHFEINDEMAVTSSVTTLQVHYGVTKFHCSLLCIEETYCNILSYNKTDKICKLYKTASFNLQSQTGWISLIRKIELIYEKGKFLSANYYYRCNNYVAK